MPTWGNCDGVLAITLIINWLFALAYVYFISVSYEYYMMGCNDEDLIKADADYTDRIKKEAAEQELDRQEKAKLQTELTQSLHEKPEEEQRLISKPEKEQ